LKESIGALARRCSAGAVLLLICPILGAACVAIWLEDRAPFFFRQKRVGQHGRMFDLLKLRSMRVAASGKLITREGDHRITRVGAFLRRFKLDELPQLWNILRGDMYWIGPRPEVPRYVEINNSMWSEVLKLKPGITDLATLVFRDEEKLLAQYRDIEGAYRQRILPAKLALNLQYAQARNWWTDLKLLILTARYSFVRRGFDANRVSRAVLGTSMNRSSATATGEVPHV